MTFAVTGKWLLKKQWLFTPYLPEEQRIFSVIIKRLGNVFLYGSDAKTKVITKAKKQLAKKIIKNFATGIAK